METLLNTRQNITSYSRIIAGSMATGTLLSIGYIYLYKNMMTFVFANIILTFFLMCYRLIQGAKDLDIQISKIIGGVLKVLSLNIVLIIFAFLLNKMSVGSTTYICILFFYVGSSYYQYRNNRKLMYE